FRPATSSARSARIRPPSGRTPGACTVPQSRSPAVPQSRSPAVPQSIVGGGTDRAVPHRPCPGYGGAAAPHSAASSASPAALVLTGAVLLARAEQFVGQRREVVQRGLLGPVRPLPAPPGRRSLGGLHLRQLTRAVDGARGRLGAALRALVAEVARRNPAVPVVPGVPGVRAVAAHRGQHSGLVRGTRR